MTISKVIFANNEHGNKRSSIRDLINKFEKLNCLTDRSDQPAKNLCPANNNSRRQNNVMKSSSSVSFSHGNDYSSHKPVVKLSSEYRQVGSAKNEVLQSSNNEFISVQQAQSPTDQLIHHHDLPSMTKTNADTEMEYRLHSDQKYFEAKNASDKETDTATFFRRTKSDYRITSNLTKKSKFYLDFLILQMCDCCCLDFYQNNYSA
jgi:hypothetical protein